MTPISLNPLDIAPFEVHWRPHLTSGWMLIKGVDAFEAAVTIARDSRKQWGGQTRITTQSVLEAHGLGAQEFVEAELREATARSVARSTASEGNLSND